MRAYADSPEVAKIKRGQDSPKSPKFKSIVKIQKNPIKLTEITPNNLNSKQPSTVQNQLKMPYGYGDAGLGNVVSAGGRMFRSLDQNANESNLKTDSDRPFEQKRWMRNAHATGMYGHERAQLVNDKRSCDLPNLKGKKIDQEDMNRDEEIMAEV